LDRNTAHSVEYLPAHFRLTFLIGTQVVSQAFQAQKIKQRSE